MSSSYDTTSNSDLPLREIPGSYGIPFLGAIKDRLDYFYNQGQDEYFNTLMKKYQSTVFRANMPPGPFLAPNPKVIVLLDSKSFPILFDNSKVEKKNVFEGTYMPSLNFTGGYRMCAYLDPSEPNHSKLKGFISSLLLNLHSKFIPTFRSSISDLFINLEDELLKKKQADFNAICYKMSLDFVFRLFSDKSPTETPLEGASVIDTWLFLQLAPLMPLAISYVPNFVIDFALHTFPLPFWLVKSNYNKLYQAFDKSSSSILDEAEKNGINRDEACHNLIFMGGFNTYGGLKTIFPTLIKWVGIAGEEFHRRLADEIRTVVKKEGGVTLSAINKMILTKSTVYEVMRIEPPVPYQYGKAKKDIIINSHNSRFLIKKGEMIFGYQSFATKDPKVFTNPEEFNGDRFTGDGKKLIKYVYWSNGRETDDPTVDNKQCPGKDLVVLLCMLMLVEIFLRYDTFDMEASKFLLGSSVTLKSLTKAS